MGAQGHFEGHYVEWQQKRIAAIAAHYGGPEAFRGKTILELGCGHGDIGGWFKDNCGSVVTFSDARAEHLEAVKSKYPDAATYVADLNSEWPFPGTYDFIFHMGVLYHLDEFQPSLEKSFAASKHIVFETEVCDSFIHDLCLKQTETGYDQAFGGWGSRPSEILLERIFCHFKVSFFKVLDDRCNSGIHRYDWEIEGSDQFSHGQRRFYFLSGR